ncbi:hypothetical protein SAMN02745116_01040 [Pilibacter termitis]|uniref:Uncharacterized protein n=1 Tax=Pilibacter termitis TaxID=263852 RepID=A0A1T4MC83_9ENTE|nr:hypothetical protein [Pilibacter termitis]SJZ64486.1 hypothetical protein SAMN02745116_01040 [Pilibacter termitis]
MAQAIRLDDFKEKEVFLLSKQEYDDLQREIERLKKENSRNKAKIRYYQEMQKGIFSTANGEGRLWEEAKKELWGKMEVNY